MLSITHFPPMAQEDDLTSVHPARSIRNFVAGSMVAHVDGNFLHLLPGMRKAGTIFADPYQLTLFAETMRHRLNRVRLIAIRGHQGFWEEKRFHTIWLEGGSIRSDSMTWTEFVRSEGERRILLVHAQSKMKLVR